VLSAMLIVYRTPVYRIKLFEMSAMWLPTLGTPLAPSSVAILRLCRQTRCCATINLRGRGPTRRATCTLRGLTRHAGCDDSRTLLDHPYTSLSRVETSRRPWAFWPTLMSAAQLVRHSGCDDKLLFELLDIPTLSRASLAMPAEHLPACKLIFWCVIRR